MVSFALTLRTETKQTFERFFLASESNMKLQMIYMQDTINRLCLSTSDESANNVNVFALLHLLEFAMFTGPITVFRLDSDKWIMMFRLLYIFVR